MADAFQSDTFQHNTFQVLEVYGLSCSDGLKAGESLLGGLLLNLLVADGVKLSEGMPPCFQIAAFQLDAFQTESIPSILLEANPVLTDGLKVGDSALIGLLYGLLVSDGGKIGDSLSHSAILGALALDGVKLGDTSATTAILNALAADGLKLGDSPIAGLLLALALTDGTKLSETLATLLEHYPALIDGIKLGDASTITPLLELIKMLLKVRSGARIKVEFEGGGIR